MDKFYIYNHDIVDLTINITKQLKFDIDYVIGIARGGLIPAVWISHALNKPLLTVNLQSYDNEEQKEIKWIQTIDQSLIERKHLLIVDDICDTGNTFKAVARHCQTAKTIQYAAVIKKYSSPSDIICYSAIVGNDNKWYVFPWEEDINSNWLALKWGEELWPAEK